MDIWKAIDRIVKLNFSTSYKWIIWSSEMIALREALRSRSFYKFFARASVKRIALTMKRRGKWLSPPSTDRSVGDSRSTRAVGRRTSIQRLHVVGTGTSSTPRYTSICRRVYASAWYVPRRFSVRCGGGTLALPIITCLSYRWCDY